MNQYDIYLADLNPTIGREQKGVRPVLIISNRDTQKRITQTLCMRFEVI